MKKNLLLISGLFLLLTCAHGQYQVTFNFTLGILSDSSGIPVTDGSLLLIVASTSGTFAAPSLTDFLGGNTNERILWKGAFDSSTTGAAGGMLFSLSNVPLPFDTITGGSKLDIFWYPSLSSTATAPGAGSPFGVYGWSTGDTAWVVPGGAGTYDFPFITAGAGGTLPDSAARATLSTVPEPAACALLIGILGLAIAGASRLRPRRS